MALTLTIGGHVQTDYLLAGMSLKLNTFDFALLDPATLPEIGDAVVLADPTWTGIVTSRSIADTVEKGSHTTVSLTATNEDEAGASAAPFGLSDAPSPPTTYGYAGLSTRTTHNSDGTDSFEGQLICRQEGLWPAMTFELTSANRGYAAESFSITDVTVTWPTGKENDAAYAVSFGDPIVTMSVWVASQAANAPDGSISGTKITDNTVTTPKLVANCVTADKIDTEAIDFRTLGKSAHDVITAHVPNNMFFEAIAGLLPIGASRDDAAGHTANCPYWWVWRTTGTGTATVVTDAAWPGGKYVEMRFSDVGSATTNNIALTTPLSPVSPGMQLTPGRMAARNVPAGVVLHRDTTLLFYAADGSFISSETASGPVTGPDTTGPTSGPGTTVMVPSNARSGRLEVNCWLTGTYDAATYYRIGMVAAQQEWSFGNYLDDLTVGGTLHLTGGTLHLTAGLQLGTGLFGSATFPGSPSLGLAYFRYDLGEWCYYDGTRWLSCATRYVGLGDSSIAVLGATTNTSIGRTNTAELTALPAVGLVALEVALAVSSTVYDIGGNNLIVYDYAENTAGYKGVLAGVANTYLLAGYQVVPGGTNGRQFAYSVGRAAGTITYYVRVTGYWAHVIVT